MEVTVEAAERRRAGRVVMVDPTGAVLLISGRDPSVPAAETFWLVPGGGAHEGETTDEAARREVAEEVGAELGELGPVAWWRRTSFAFAGLWYDQEESFYVVRAPSFVPHPTALTELEVQMTTGARWWPLAELVATGEVVHPRQLGALVTSWLSIGPPARPVRID
ncbi:MAG: NUDIX hydrolase [Acidimicrobiales bacterium]